jgi:hypothetical protein
MLWIAQLVLDVILLIALTFAAIRAHRKSSRRRQAAILINQVNSYLTKATLGEKRSSQAYVAALTELTELKNQLEFWDQVTVQGYLDSIAFNYGIATQSPSG